MFIWFLLLAVDSVILRKQLKLSIKFTRDPHRKEKIIKVEMKKHPVFFIDMKQDLD